MNFKRIISVFLSVVILSAFLPVYAANDGVINISSYVDGKLVDKAFKGEEIESVISLKNISGFQGSDFILRYNKDVVQLISDDPDNISATEENGVILGDDYIDDFSKAYEIVSKENGLIMLVSYSQDSIDIADKDSVYLTLRFKAISDGEMDLRFADGNNDNDVELVAAVSKNYHGLAYGLKEQNPTGYTITSDDPNAKQTVNNSNVTVLNAPETPTGFSWDTGNKFIGIWEPVYCRGYIVDVLKDDGIVEQAVELDENVTSINIFDIILREGFGEYSINIRAKGCDNNYSGTLYGDKKLFEAQKLEKVENIILNEETKNLSWNKVENATSYIVEVLKGTDIVGTETISDSLSCDLSSVISSVGEYTIKVTADTDNKLYTKSEPSEISYSTGSSVKGKISYRTNKGNKLSVNHILPTRVTLVNEETSEKYEAIVKSDDTFEITGIKDGTYSVSINRDSAGIKRDFSKKLILNGSVEKTISKGNGLLYIVGDINNSGIVDIHDITGILGGFGYTVPGEGNQNYNQEYDFIKSALDINDNHYIDANELMVVINNFSARAANTYDIADDYDF